MRILGLLSVLALLSACNVVHSPKPMFSVADAEGAPSLRGGVWAAPDRGCDFDPNKPVETWPSCANGAPDGFGLKPGEGLLLIPGDPMIVQYRQVNDAHEVQYFYGGMRPVSQDASGWITAAEFWSIQCGPPQPPRRRAKARYSIAHPDPNPAPPSSGTHHPLPGMVMDTDGDNCTPQTTDAIRAAALPSRKWSNAIQMIHWVRDGAH